MIVFLSLKHRRAHYSRCFNIFYTNKMQIRSSNPTFIKTRKNAATKYKNIFNPIVYLKNTRYSKTPQDTFNILWGFLFVVFSSYKDGGLVGTCTRVLQVLSELSTYLFRRYLSRNSGRTRKFRSIPL